MKKFFYIVIATAIVIILIGFASVFSSMSKAVGGNWGGWIFWLAILCVAGFIWLTHKNVGGAGWVGIAALLLLLTYWLGPNNVAVMGQTAGARIAGVEDPPVAPLDDQAQKDRLKREAQEREALAPQQEAAAAQRVLDAAATAKAAEAARLVTIQTSNLPPNIAVPHCDKGMSKPLAMIPGWRVTAGWGVGSTPFDYLSNGEWKRATTIRVTESVDAVRYCTKSKENTELGLMPLKWYPQ